MDVLCYNEIVDNACGENWSEGIRPEDYHTLCCPQRKL